MEQPPRSVSANLVSMLRRLQFSVPEQDLVVLTMTLVTLLVTLGGTLLFDMP
jgi:hypothetical protein